MRKMLSTLKNSKLFMAMTFVICGLIASQIITRTLVFGSNVIGDSMYPTFNNGQNVWVSRVSEPERGDIVIVDEGYKYVIKRLVGMPGDTIQIVDGTVYLNGKEYKEPYVINHDYSSGIAETPVTLGEGEYFILGDNRIVSRDSREIGAVNEEDIIGVVIVLDLGVERVY